MHELMINGEVVVLDFALGVDSAADVVFGEDGAGRVRREGASVLPVCELLDGEVDVVPVDLELVGALLLALTLDADGYGAGLLVGALG